MVSVGRDLSARRLALAAANSSSAVETTGDRGRAVSNTVSQGDGVPLLLWCTGVATTPGWAAYVHLMDHWGQKEGPSERLWIVWTYRWIFVCSGARSPQSQNKSLK